MFSQCLQTEVQFAFMILNSVSECELHVVYSSSYQSTLQSSWVRIRFSLWKCSAPLALIIGVLHFPIPTGYAVELGSISYWLKVTVKFIFLFASSLFFHLCCAWFYLIKRNLFTFQIPLRASASSEKGIWSYKFPNSQHFAQCLAYK